MFKLNELKAKAVNAVNTVKTKTQEVKMDIAKKKEFFNRCKEIMKGDKEKAVTIAKKANPKPVYNKTKEVTLKAKDTVNNLRNKVASIISTN